MYIFIESESLTWKNYFPSQPVISYAMPLKTATNFICFLWLAVINQYYLKNLMMHSYWWSKWKSLHSEQQHQQITWKCKKNWQTVKMSDYGKNIMSWNHFFFLEKAFSLTLILSSNNIIIMTGAVTNRTYRNFENCILFSKEIDCKKPSDHLIMEKKAEPHLTFVIILKCDWSTIF